MKTLSMNQNDLIERLAESYFHDPQTDDPIAYCPICGMEIYSQEAYEMYDGLCEDCFYREEEDVEC